MFYMIIFILLLIPTFLTVLNLLIGKKEVMDREKLSSFECGFTPLSSSRLPFSINFYLIMILFLVFDVEIVFLLPFISLMNFLVFSETLFVMFYIILILYVGLEFEKKEGSLKWLF